MEKYVIIQTNISVNPEMTIKSESFVIGSDATYYYAKGMAREKLNRVVGTIQECHPGYIIEEVCPEKLIIRAKNESTHILYKLDIKRHTF